ncbi:MAG: hydrogenase 3 maturation endopeptidase HyCI [Candidatus Bathyarchaeota archaeon]|nr:hydrogenase 3 maturation endopeptidase HyCI [Candidatus Bathyarchaeota archaeon]
MADSENQTADIESALKEWFSGAQRVVIAGIGNPFRRDDYVGVEIVKKLENKTSKNVILIQAETVPESYLHQITELKPTHMLIIDAGLMNLQPGNAKLVDPEQLMRKTAISTHTLPLGIFCDYIAKTSGTKVSLLVIQPYDTGFGEGLTPTLKKTAKQLADLLLMLLPKTGQ